MYSMVALLIIPATTCFIRAYALDTENRRPWIAGLRDLGRGRALHAQLADLLHHQRRGRVGAAVGAGRQAAPARAACATACSASAGCSCSTCRGSRRRSTRPRTPARPWADAPALDSLLGVPGVLLGRMPQIVLLICAGAGLIALVRRPLSERGRAALCLAIIAVLTPTIAWLLSQASPAWANRYLAVALPPFLLLAAGGLASARRLGHRRPRAGGDHVGAGRRAGGEVQRPRDHPRDHAEPAPRRPGHLHAARDDPGPALLPAAGA